jgi:hypothetical protein
VDSVYIQSGYNQRKAAQHTMHTMANGTRSTSSTSKRSSNSEGSSGRTDQTPEAGPRAAAAAAAMIKTPASVAVGLTPQEMSASGNNSGAITPITRSHKASR